MREMNKLTGKILLLFLVLAGCLNLFVLKWQTADEDRLYQVSLNRVERAVQAFEREKGRAVKNIKELAEYAGVSGYEGITGILWTDVEGKQPDLFWKNDGREYAVIATESHYYKVTYELKQQKEPVLLWVNVTALMFLFGIFGVLLFIRRKLLLPFHQLSQLPYELSRGNLTVPLKENKNRFFGKFLWGMNLLRENLEEQKRRELELQKEKKLLLLSLSHDIKTPLSAIKLYARALSRNLYRSEEKKQEIAESINQKADEIESYISEIVRASNEDFLDFRVENQEIYIGRVLEEIWTYYEEKLALSQISFQMGSYPNCLVYADPDRLVEVLQNVIENAIKYGDGESITIYAEREAEEYLISIKNSGCDLSANELPHIFDSFFRGSNVEKQPGSGLGLYICRQLLHRMEGEITASVERRGEGSSMHVVIALRVL